MTNGIYIGKFSPSSLLTVEYVSKRIVKAIKFDEETVHIPWIGTFFL